jgi:hypothetical protein
MFRDALGALPVDGVTPQLRDVAQIVAASIETISVS